MDDDILSKVVEVEKEVQQRIGVEKNMSREWLENVKRDAEEKLLSTQKLIDEKKEFVSDLDKLEVLLYAKKDLELRMKREITLMQKQIHEKIDFSEERLQSVLELLNKHKNIFEDKNAKFIEVSSHISVLDSKKEAPLKLKEKVMLLENCPTCFQMVGHEHKSKISKRTQFEIEEINRELEQKLIRKEPSICQLIHRKSSFSSL